MTQSNHIINEMEGTEREISAMTSDLVDMHHETLPAMKSAAASWELTRDTETPTTGLSRRSFLTRSGLFAAGGLLVATTGASASTLPRAIGKLGEAPHMASLLRPPLDVKVAALAASLENLAVATYKSALSAATSGKLGAVPSAVAKFVETAMSQHVDHAAAWNAIIARAGYDHVTAPNAPVGRVVATAFAKVTDVPGVALLALSLEEAAAATYLEAIGVVTARQAIETAATIQPVEMQHAAILNFVLGKYPVPRAFAGTQGSATLKQAPALKRR